MLIKARELPEILPILDNISPLLTRVYASRGIINTEQLDKKLAKLLPPSFKSMDQAINLLIQALQKQQQLLIVGDFDADGATATTVAVLGLKMLGFKHVEYLVPNRFEYGYGLTPEIVELAKAYKPDLLITVDNGISSIEGVSAAKKAGMQVLITDHHLPGNSLPESDAIVNPNQLDCPFPSKALAGVGVMFYVLLALRTALRAQNYFAEQGIVEPNLSELLDLVALGTVADVVPLDSNNRRFVYHGLKRIQKGATRPAIKALLQLTKREFSRATTMDLGFILGPRINAAGRLDNMKLGIDCLLCEDQQQAYEMASQLHELNSDRKQIEAGMQKEALKQLQNISLDDLPWGICLYQADWHQGVIGILASRLKDKYYRPTVIFAESEQEGTLKASARSIPGFHIRDALERIANRHPNLVSKFGGHAMAAGLSINKEQLPLFTKAFNDDVMSQLQEEQLTNILYTDGGLADHEFTLDQAKQLAEAGPWGQAFPEPVFDGVFWIEKQYLLKEKHLKLILQTADKQQEIEAIAFGVDRAIWPNPNIKQVQVIFQLTVNEYKGLEKPQLVISYIKPLGST